MIINYRFENTNFKYEPTDEMLEKCLKELLGKLSKEDLIEALICGDDVKICLYEDIKDYFYTQALEEFRDSKYNW